MMTYIISFFRPGLLFNFRPAPMEGTGLYITLTLFGLIFIFGIALSFVLKKKSADKIVLKGVNNIKAACYTMGVLGLLYAFFAYEGAIFLGARLWFLLFIIIFIAWLAFPLWYLIKKVPKIKEGIQKRKEFEKYLP